MKSTCKHLEKLRLGLKTKLCKDCPLRKGGQR